MPDWANISVGVAAVLGLIYVARVLRGIMQDQLQYAREQNQYLGNHMTEITKAMNANTQVLEQLVHEVREVRRSTRSRRTA